MEKSDLIYVAGHTGLVGSAIVRLLKKEGYNNLVLRTHQELDLTNQEDVKLFYREHRPNYVFLAAAKVGGILANMQFPADFIYENLMIDCNVIHESHVSGVKKLLFLGSSCIYPKYAKQPINEAELLSGKLEPTNEPYAIAKIAGIKMCDSYRRQHGADFISVMPTNLYGPNDNFDLESSHVIPALLRKFHEARIHDSRTVSIWGTGTPRREFLYVDDLADALVFLMNNYSDEGQINVGTGDDVTILELANIIGAVVEFTGKPEFDRTKPDGTPRKLMDISKLKELGWTPSTPLKKGLKMTYDWFLQNEGRIVSSEGTQSDKSEQ
ncbi:MAG: GDP-L-fucose synthase family protein [Candidatus Thorarchaeota archaeon]